MTLYEIDSAIMDCVDEETGEIIDLEKLEALNIERDKKVEGIALAVKNYAAEAKAIKEEEEKLAKRRRSCENAVEVARTPHRGARTICPMLLTVKSSRRQESACHTEIASL